MAWCLVGVQHVALFCDLVACRVVVWFACVGDGGLFVLCLLLWWMCLWFLVL